MLAVAALLGSLLTWAVLAWLSPHVPTRVVIAEIPPPENNVFESIGDLSGIPVISPQGDRVAFVGLSKDFKQWLWVRSLDSISAVKLDGTEGAAHPFWSPDGTQIGFFTATKLKRVPAAGGPVVELDTCPNARGGSWNQDGVILYAPDFRGPIMRIDAVGGKPAAATTLDVKLHTTHRWPSLLPDGKHFLYFATNHNVGNPDANGLYFASLDGKENKFIMVTDSAATYAGGNLFFHTQTSLQTQPFDPSNGKLSGTPSLVVGNVRFDAGVWRSVFSVSSNGVLVYQLSSSAVSGSQLAWYDRSGKPLKEIGEKMHQADVRISPDGKKAVLLAGDPSWEVWIVDLERGGRTRITYNEGTPLNASWSPDGKNIIYTSTNQGGNMADVRTKPWYGGPAKVLTTELHTYAFPAYTSDGKYIYYVSSNGTGQKGTALFAQSTDGDHKPFVVVAPPSTQSNIAMGKVSPDGKWVAYQSDETGRDEVYIAPFPKGDGKWQVSNTGAGFPLWRADGKELFYSTLDERLTAVAISEKADHLEIGTPQVLFTVTVSAVGYGLDLSADGQRVLLNRSEESTSAPLYLMLNWQEALKKK